MAAHQPGRVVAEPGVEGDLAVLEDLVDPLLVRSSRQEALTAAGTMLLEEARRVLRQPLRLALPADHPQAGAAVVALEDMDGSDWVATPRDKGVGFHDGVLDVCRRAGFAPRIVQRARQMHTVKALVASGLGVAFVPENGLEQIPPGVVLKPFTVAGSTGGLGIDLLMAWNPRRDSPARDRFLAVARAVAAGS